MNEIDIFINSVLNGNYIEKKFYINEQKIESREFAKYIVNYFNIMKHYPEFSNSMIDQNEYKKIIHVFKNYEKNKLVNVPLTEELKRKLNKCDSKEIHCELQKVMQNRLTNTKVIKYIKELIDKKNLYIYDKYYKYSKIDSEKEIERLNKMFEILKDVPYKKNEMGIDYKSIYFKPGSHEYETFCPSLNLDIYDISYYKRVYQMLKDKINNQK